jgi:hypothetical protein
MKGLVGRVSEQPRCDYCGDLGWTVERYGRVTHKQGCPHRTDPWHQGEPLSGDLIREQAEEIKRLEAVVEEGKHLRATIQTYGDHESDEEHAPDGLCSICTALFDAEDRWDDAIAALASKSPEELPHRADADPACARCGGRGIYAGPKFIEDPCRGCVGVPTAEQKGPLDGKKSASKSPEESPEQTSAPPIRSIPGRSEREGSAIAPGESDAQAGTRAVEMSDSAESATPPPRSSLPEPAGGEGGKETQYFRFEWRYPNWFDARYNAPGRRLPGDHIA